MYSKNLKNAMFEIRNPGILLHIFIELRHNIRFSQATMWILYIQIYICICMCVVSVYLVHCTYIKSCACIITQSKLKMYVICLLYV